MAVVEQITPPPPAPTYVLTLTAFEAESLVKVLGLVGGHGPRRSAVLDVSSALQEFIEADFSDIDIVNGDTGQAQRSSAVEFKGEKPYWR